MRWLSIVMWLVVGCGEDSEGRGAQSGAEADEMSEQEPGAEVGETCERMSDCADGLTCAPSDCFAFDCADSVCMPTCETQSDCWSTECCVLLDTEEPSACMSYDDAVNSGGLYVCPN